MRTIKKIYVKYHLLDKTNPFEPINLYAKVSEDKITLRTYNNNKYFEFTNSGQEKVKKICEMILEVLEK